MRTPDGSQHRHQAYLRQTFLIELSTDLGKSVANSWRKLGNLRLDITISYPLRYRRFRASTTATPIPPLTTFYATCISAGSCPPQAIFSRDGEFKKPNFTMETSLFNRNFLSHSEAREWPKKGLKNPVCRVLRFATPPSTPRIWILATYCKSATGKLKNPLFYTGKF